MLESALNALSIQEMTARVYETSGCRYRGRRPSRLDFLDVVHGTPFRAGPERCPQGDAPATMKSPPRNAESLMISLPTSKIAWCSRMLGSSLFDQAGLGWLHTSHEVGAVQI